MPDDRRGTTTIETCRPAFPIEIHPFLLRRNMGREPQSILDFLLAQGYEALRLDDDDAELVSARTLDTGRRCRDCFLVHPSRAGDWPRGPLAGAKPA